MPYVTTGYEIRQQSSGICWWPGWELPNLLSLIQSHSPTAHKGSGFFSIPTSTTTKPTALTVLVHPPTPRRATGALREV